MHQALYRKWRPQIFDDVCGQDHITSVLKYESQHHAFSHAYLFCGSRGTGKTTCAKILAKAVNCENPIDGNPCGKCASCQAIDAGAATDVLEMDAASNNGVDNIRDIRDEVIYPPSALRYRVYIIDEVHMLSVSAFNALLKTLEEPPEHVVFILATTELQKLPATIISRCQRFDFRRISTEALTDRLTYIAKQEGIELVPDAARLLAKLAQGGMRDAISLLELCSGVQKKVTLQTVEDSVGLIGRETILKTVWAVAERNYDAMFEQIEQVVRSSKDLAVYWQDLIAIWRDMLILKTAKNATAYLDFTDSELEQMRQAALLFSKETLIYQCKLLEDALFAMQKANAVKRIVAEMTLIRLADPALDNSTEAILSRLAQVEERLDGHALSASVLEASKSQKEKIPSATKEEKAENVKPNGGLAAVASPEKRVLRPIRNWMEVVERVGRSSPMQAGLLKASRAYTADNGTVIVRFDSDFALQMVEKDDGKERLRGALSNFLRREVTDNSLIFETAPKAEELSALDEIIEASEDVQVRGQ